MRTPRTHSTISYSRLTGSALVAGLLLSGCPGGEGADAGAPLDAAAVADAGAGGDAGAPADAGFTDAGFADAAVADGGAQLDAGAPPVVVLPGPTKGGPIAANPRGDTLAVANKATQDVTLFALPAMTERARVRVGEEPVSVCWGPDGATLYVVSRASATVTRVTGADGAQPLAGAPVDVGSEPSQCALSPTGASLYVSNWADGTLSVIATADMSLARTVSLGGAPHGVCVTNDGDTDDADETLFVTDFYARGIAGRKEATDTARQGRVWRLPTADLAPAEILLAPEADSGIPTPPGTGAYPNQLYACIVNRDRVYVTHVGASPAASNGTTDFRQNIQGYVHVLSLAGELDEARTVNVNVLVDGQTAPKRFVSVPVDIAFAPNSDIGYVVSILGNSLFRIDWTAGAPTGGSTRANFLVTGASPTGAAIVGSTAYVYNEVGRSVSVIDLAQQTTTTQDAPSAPQPTTDAERRALRGQRFFNTGLGRWSANGWVGCVGCHPFGLTDNVTWSFPAGPRQTVDTGATFDRGGTVQRILNWSAIFDEIHDFELNTRGVANGTGAIVSTADLNADGSPNGAARIDFVGAGGVANPQNGFNVGSAAAVAATGAVPGDWDEIEAYIKTIRSPRASRSPGGDPAAGRAVFMAGNCHFCHGGALWTLSERYYRPRLDFDTRQTTLAAAGVTSVGAVPADQLRTTDTSAMRVIENDANGAPQRHACVVRKVGTFDADGPGGRGADELRQNGGPAQGVDGFNVPSLLGVGLGAPFLHNGAAESLEELLDPQGRFLGHLRAGNQVFSPTPTELANLIAFLRSIDDDTAPIAVPADRRFCPSGL